jgi:hypothetical protein
VLPFQRPIPPSPDSSAALLEAFEERGIRFVSGGKVATVERDRRVLTLELAATLIGELRGTDETGTHAGTGSCYIEVGAGRIGRVDIDFLSSPQPTGTFRAPSAELRAEKDDFGATRHARWFARTA